MSPPSRSTSSTLLELVRDAFGVDVEIQPDDELVIDRSLDGSRFAAETGIARRPGRI